MKLNGIDSSRARLLMVDERPEQSYPLVFANILQNILHQDRDYLINSTHPDGFLILSGLLKTQVNETRSLYLQSQRVVLESEEVKGDWGCIVLRRSR
jgi:ribosomal protein L11 methylase PrmA